MSTGIDEPAIPYWLCQYCENVTRQLTAVIKKGVKHDFRVEHYPNMQAFIDGILERRCYLCAVFVGGIANLHFLRTVEEVLEKLDEHHDKADRPLLMDVSMSFRRFSVDDDPRQYGQPGWLDTDTVYLGYEKYGSVLENVSFLTLKYNKRGIGKKDVSPELLSAFTGSDQSCALIKKWLRICSTEHCGCCSSSKHFVPTRLLDLGTRGTDDIRLVTAGTIGQVPYAALSYCWGSIPQLVLSSENQADFIKKIPFASLSRVAQDAATVCRAVSMRYLWIDAMCIMQGPEGDFHQEAGRMEEVYANALFTICAGVSEDTTQPFLIHRDPLWWTSCHLVEDESRESRGYICADYCEFSADVPGNYNLDSRGWCFQELFLSPRSIYFGPKGVHWICREGTVCDRYPDFEGFRGIKDHDGPEWESPKQLYDRLVSLGDDISAPATNSDFCDVWEDIRHDYSSKHLRYQSDRLLALAGVASIIQRKFNTKASFGLWLEVFHEQLLWVVSDLLGNKGARLDIAPSWSWANLGNCQISGCVGYVSDTKYRLLNSFSATVVSLPPVTGFTIPLQDSGYSYNTSIRLSGRLTACVQDHESKDLLFPKDYPSDPTQQYGTYFPDTDLEEKNLYCFLIKRDLRVVVDGETREDLNRGHMKDYCLVLTPVTGSDYRFRRVGYYYERSDWRRDHGGAPSLHPHMFRGEGKEQEIEVI